jgi:hypothetical protein
MIERDVLLNDGRTFKFHEFEESVVDFENKKIKYLTRSWESESSQDYVTLFVEVSFSVWDPSLVDNANAVAAIGTGDFKQKGIIEPVIKTFAERQDDKSKEISNACRMAIVSGFTSMALGEEYSYPSKTIDQQNLAASVLASYDPENPPEWLTPFWCMDESGQWAFRPHTALQIREVGRDAKSNILGYQFHNEQLQALISSATTIEELDAISW